MDSLLLLTLLPTYLLIKYVYNMDKVEREPMKLLIILFMGGILAIPLTMFLSNSLKNFIPYLNNKNIFFYNFINVALIEEFSKWLFLFLISWKNKNFNFLFDGIVYGSVVALGFATVENILYVFGASGGFQTALLRAIISVPGHFFFGVFMGYYYGIAKKKKSMLIFSLIIPVILHAIFDLCLSIQSSLITLCFILFVLLLYLLSFRRIKKLSGNDEYIG